MSDLNIVPIVPQEAKEITYNQILTGLQGQVSDKFLYISVFILAFFILNMFVFKEGARFRKYFDNIDYEIEHIGSLRSVIYEVMETSAYLGAAYLVYMNLVFKMGWTI